jgi:hypothetical protein
MREKLTLSFCMAGPGFDHALFKPPFSAFDDIAQVIYDHRGNGRSGGDDPATWNLAQWGRRRRETIAASLPPHLAFRALRATWPRPVPRPAGNAPSR